MTVRFLADENFDHKTLAGLRRQEPRVLEWAAQEGRIVVTHDVSTFADFAYERVAKGLPMPG